MFTSILIIKPFFMWIESGKRKTQIIFIDTKKYPEFGEISPGQGLRCMGVFYHPTLIVRSIFIRHCSHEGRRKDLAG